MAALSLQVTARDFRGSHSVTMIPLREEMAGKTQAALIVLMWASAALLLIVLSSARSVSEGLIYIAVFGFGSIMGMVLVGMVVSLPVLWSLNLGRPVFLTVQGLASLGSVAVGLMMMFQTAFGGQLF